MGDGIRVDPQFPDLFPRALGVLEVDRVLEKERGSPFFGIDVHGEGDRGRRRRPSTISSTRTSLPSSRRSVCGEERE
jgi:hypothetical protein